MIQSWLLTHRWEPCQAKPHNLARYFTGGWLGHVRQSLHKPRDLKPPTHLYSDSQPCVRKTFPLLSFLSQRKTTLFQCRLIIVRDENLRRRSKVNVCKRRSLNNSILRFPRFRNPVDRSANEFRRWVAAEVENASAIPVIWRQGSRKEKRQMEGELSWV